MSEHPLVYIKWVDAYDYSNGWSTIPNMETVMNNDWVVDQTGWVWEETEEYILIVNMICYPGNSVSHATKIPKPWILERKEITL